MSNHNYSQYSNKKHNPNNHNKPKAEATIDVEHEAVYVKHTVPEVEPAEVKMEAPKAEVKTIVPGTVSGCAKLNVRVKPTTDSDVLIVLDNGSEVMIDPARSTNEWLKITTAAGIDGFCMRKFVSAKM